MEWEPKLTSVVKQTETLVIAAQRKRKCETFVVDDGTHGDKGRKTEEEWEIFIDHVESDVN